MKPGNELDVLVASKVMGMIQHPDYKHLWRENEATSAFMPVPRFSTDISFAWLVAEKMKSLSEGQFILTFQPAGRRPSGVVEASWIAGFGEDTWDGLQLGEFYAQAPTAPHAICLAALKAVGVQL